MTSAQITFLILAGIAAISAIGVVALNSPVRSALVLVVNFFVLAFLYFSLGAQLLGITQILVYAGAIMVLFLFVIMLLNLGNTNSAIQKKDGKPLIGIICGIGLFGLIASQIILPMGPRGQTAGAAPGYGSPQAVGYTLFTNYAWAFEITSILLLVGIVGSILLAKRRLKS
ncbi:MAG TPA: NADH-quinone oxidoreductase subunit J [Fimbriimonadaceae bacterium]|nr:NADH-quinone oxidoreductase subunit J [Fimbriimonadaceae bacterium]HRJ32526.1 NADH-quinone oxidoreductase subunit J [Fimbriimonadaceae bacterium]